jgi:hypothetical protein
VAGSTFTTESPSMLPTHIPPSPTAIP